jgi:hypothetical protein
MHVHFLCKIAKLAIKVTIFSSQGTGKEGVTVKFY